jgi:hypothetical protein
MEVSLESDSDSYSACQIGVLMGSKFKCGDTIRPKIAPNYVGMVLNEPTDGQDKYFCRLIQINSGLRPDFDFNSESCTVFLMEFEIEAADLPWAKQSDSGEKGCSDPFETKEADPRGIPWRVNIHPTGAGKTAIMMKAREDDMAFRAWASLLEHPGSRIASWAIPSDGDDNRPLKDGDYSRFTDRARKVMQLANQEAQGFHHEYVGTEHLLLGLIKEGSGVAAYALKALGVDLRKIRLEVEKLVESGPYMVTMGKLPQTPRARNCIKWAYEEANKIGHRYIGTEHLLLGLSRETEGVASQVLMNLGVDLESARTAVLVLLGLSK